MLYRVALTGFLGLSFEKPIPPMSDAEKFGQYISDHFDFMSYQRKYEDALLTAVKASR
jgi:hypothetical protein